MTPEALAAFFGTKVALPRRAKGNAWAVGAAYREQQASLDRDGADDAKPSRPPVEPTALHHHLASLSLPMIVDTWYDGAMRAALGGRADWGEIQGITRAGIGEDRWYRFYDAQGKEADRDGGKGLDDAALQAAWQHRAGQEFPDLRCRLCRGPDRDRHSDANSRHRKGPTQDRPKLSLHRLSLPRSAVCEPMRGRSPSARQTRTTRSSSRTRSPRTSCVSWWSQGMTPLRLPLARAVEILLAALTHSASRFE